MTEKITQTDLDNLADIIWWIKGYRAAIMEDSCTPCDFGLYHIESLRNARVVLRKHITLHEQLGKDEKRE